MGPCALGLFCGAPGLILGPWGLGVAKITKPIDGGIDFATTTVLKSEKINIV